MPKIPINSIEIDPAELELCRVWSGGLYCMLFAVHDTGGLTIGTICPSAFDGDRGRWYLSVWRDLASDVGDAVDMAEQGCDDNDGGDGFGRHADYSALSDFQDRCDQVVARLEQSYGLADWDAYDD